MKNIPINKSVQRILKTNLLSCPLAPTYGTPKGLSDKRAITPLELQDYAKELKATILRHEPRILDLKIDIFKDNGGDININYEILKTKE